MTDVVLILVTTGSDGEAEKIARALVEERLAACVNIVNPLRSVYRWEGKIQDDREWLLVIKTKQTHFAAVKARVEALHSYQVPEVIALPVVDGAEKYLEWVRSETEVET